MPTIPSVRPARSWPTWPIGFHVFHLPARVYACPSTTRRAAERSSANAMSAVASVRTTRRVADGDPALGRGVDVHVVEADGVVADDLQLRARGEERGVHLVGQEREESFAVRGRLRSTSAGGGSGSATRRRRRRPGSGEARGGDDAGDEDLGLDMRPI